MCDPLITHIDEYHHFYCFISIPAKRGKVQINAARILPLVEFAVSQARPHQPWALGAQDFQSICGSGFMALRLFSLCMSTREHCMLSALATMVMHVLTCSPVFSAHDLIFCTCLDSRVWRTLQGGHAKRGYLLPWITPDRIIRQSRAHSTVAQEARARKCIRLAVSLTNQRHCGSGLRRRS